MWKQTNWRVEELMSTLTLIVTELEYLGYVVTIDLIPNTPLAMGNYGSHINVRSARSRYAPGTRDNRTLVTPWKPQAFDGPAQERPGPIQMLDEG